MPISIEEVRRRILLALFSDDHLMDALVLKGGNALAMIYAVGDRSSLDMDFSMQSAFADLEDAKRRIFRVLKQEFSAIGYVVFDEEFAAKPTKPGIDQPEWWGGYAVEFKLIERALFEELHGEPEALRRRAAILGPLQKRIFSIDISKNEFCESKVRREVDDYTVYVYSLEMIAIEKLRAICQQMPAYTISRTRTARARDFYDIYQVVHGRNVDLTTRENLDLLAEVFAAKRVPIDLLGQIHRFRDFHILDWPSVEASISGPHGPFEEYFAFVSALASDLQALRIK